MSIHTRMAELHKILGVANDSQLGKSIDFTPQAIRRICKGLSAPSFEMLEALCKVYPNLNIRWLITGEGIPLTDETIDNSELELLITDILLMKQSMAQLLARIDALEKDR